MNYLYEALQLILILVGYVSILYVGAYIIELARQRVRRKMMVCDGCFGIIKKIKNNNK
jgi:hypothetical protein